MVAVAKINQPIVVSCSVEKFSYNGSAAVTQQLVERYEECLLNGSVEPSQVGGRWFRSCLAGYLLVNVAIELLHQKYARNEIIHA